MFLYRSDTCIFVQVRYWLTFSEPWVFLYLCYGKAECAPGLIEGGTLPYNYAHNVIKSHARAYRLYQRHFKQRYQGTHTHDLRYRHRQ